MAAMSRRLLLAAAPGLALPATLRAQAAPTIRFVVPFAAGGLTDIIARMVAQHMAQTLGQTIVVDNRPGGNAIIASEAVARAPKDGLTVLVGGTAGLPLNVLLRPNLPYKLEDFAPVALLFDGPLSLTVNAALPPRDIAGFVAHAKASPAPLRYATNGVGSVSHLFGVLMARGHGHRPGGRRLPRQRPVHRRPAGRRDRDQPRGAEPPPWSTSAPASCACSACPSPSGRRSSPRCRPSRRPATPSWWRASGPACFAPPAPRPSRWRG